MAKKLLFKVFTFWALILTSALGWGQDCVSTEPTVTITNTTGAATLCKDGTTTDTPITFTSNTISSATAYQWEVQVGNGTWTEISGANSANLSYNSAALGSNRFRLIVTYCDNSGEEDKDSTVTSTQSGIITVYEKKTGTVTISANKNNICPGENITISASPFNQGASPTYRWEVNGQQQSTASSFSSTTFESGDIVKLYMTSSAPCVEPFESNSLTINVKDAAPDQPGAISPDFTGDICPNTSATFSISEVDRATSYKWILPSGWTGQTTGTEIEVTTGAVGNGKVVSVQAINDCGTTENTISINVGPGKPAAPGAITVDTSVENDLICEGGSVTLQVPNDSSVDEYLWTLPSGWSITSGEGTNQITAKAGNFGQNGTASVTARNACLDSDARNVTLSINDPIPATPGAISGESAVCPNTEVTYSISSVTYADYYVWTLPNGTEVTTQVPEVSFNSGAPGENKILKVRATNECGDSGSSADKSIDVDNGSPDEITITSASDDSEFCPQTPQIVFSVPEDSKVDTFTWTVPNGWTINSGQGTNQVSVTSGNLNQDGNISLSASSNLCGSVSASFPVTVKNPAPSTAGISISGPDEVCASDTGIVYEIPEVQYATGYTWNVPSGWTFTGDGSRRITASAGTTDGNITVQASNECGDSGEPVTFNVVSTNAEPSTPGDITASLPNNAICPPTTQDITFSIVTVDGALYYEWDLPTGWEITNGPQNESINVKVTASANYSSSESVQVRAWNLCGPGSWSTLSGIAVDEFVVTNAGQDQTVCSVQDAVDITGSYSFAGSNRNLKPTWSTSGTGKFGNTGNLTTTYTPSSGDVANGEVTLTLTTDAPSGACGRGKDEMTIFFRPDPKVSMTGTTEICHNTSTEITFSDGIPGGVVTYTTNGSNPQTIDLDNSGAATFTTGNLSSTTTYELVSVAYPDTPSCTENEFSDVVTITVNESPTATLTYEGTSFCNSDTSTYSPTLDITGISPGGSYSGPEVLGLDANGSFSPENIPAGTYTITYTFDDELECGFEVVTADITIFEEVVIKSIGTNLRVCEGGGGQFEVIGTGDGLTFKWFKGDPGSGSLISEATTSTLVLENVSTTDAGNYYVEVSGSSPCKTETSTVVTLDVDENITITQQPTDSEICLGDTASLSVVTGDETLNYQWYKGTPGSGTPLNTSTANSAQLEIADADLDDSGSYYVVIRGSGEYMCEEITSEPAVLAVRDIPVVTISGDAEICDGGDTEISLLNGTPNAIVTYTVNNGSQQSITLDAAGVATLPTGALSVTNDEVTTYTYALVSIEYPDAPECSNDLNNSGSATITVNPTPDVNVSFENDQVTFCNDSHQGIFKPNLTGSGAYSGGTFSAEGLTVDPDDGSFTPANAPAGSYTLNYYLGEAGGCSELAATLDIEIFTSVEITSQPFPVPVCTANSTQLEMAASGDNLSYQWFKVEEGDDTEVGTNSPILELMNATVSTGGDYYVIVNGDGACSPVQSETVTVTVDENIVVTHQPSSQNVCLADDITLTVDATASGSNENIQYRWMYRPAESNNNNDWEYVDGGETQTLTLNGISTSQAGQYRAEIDGPDGYSCSLGYSQVAVVTVYEEPTADAGAATLEICSTTNPITIGDDATATNYSLVQWTTTNGQGEFVNATDLNGATYVPVVADYGKTIEFILTAILEVDGVELCAETDASDSKLVTIIPQPVITEFSYISTDPTAEAGEFCETDTTTYTPHTAGDNLANGTGFFSVDNSALTVNPTTGAITPDGTTPGTYIITYRYTANSETAGCTVAEKSFTITIGEKPIAEFSYEDTPFCSDAGNTEPLMAENAIKGTFTSTEGLVFVNNETGEINIDDSTPGTYTITNTIPAAEGCAEVTATAEITINQRPAAPEVTDVAYCLHEEDAPELTASAADGATLNWYASAETETALETAPVPNTSAAATTSYWVSQTSTAGCESERVQINVTINALPEVSITVDESIAISDAGNPVICFGSPITLTGDGATEYAWSTDSEDLGTGLTKTVSPEVTTTYIVRGTDDNICNSISEITVEVDEISLGGSISGSTNVCLSSNTGTLDLIDHRGEVIRWESSVDDWTTIVTIENTSTTLAYSNLTSTIEYRAVVQNGICNEVVSETATITVDPVSVGGDVLVQGTTDKTILVCHKADEESVTPLELFGSVGEVLRWEYSTNSGSTWTTVPVDDTPKLQGYEGITETRIYRAIVKSGSCAEVPSAVAIVSVIPNQKPSPVSARPEVVCLGDNVELYSESSFATGRNLASGGTFNNANPEGWLADGCGNCLNSGGSNTKETGFRLSATNGGTYSGVQYTSDNKFAISNGNYNSVMETPVFNLIGITDGSLEFSHSYKLVGDAEIYVEISTDGGNTYSAILWEQRDPDELTPHQNFHSSPSTKMDLDLSTFLGESNLRIRFVYKGNSDSSWAIDNISIPDAPVDERMEWVDEQTGEVISTTETAIVTPAIPGINTYRVTSYINGCRSFGEEGTEIVQVFAYDSYTAEAGITEGQNLGCGNNSIQLYSRIKSYYAQSLNPEDENAGYIEAFPAGETSTAKWFVQGLSENESDLLFDDPTSLNAVFTATPGSYILQWTITPGDAPGEEENRCELSIAEVEVTITECISLDFDGVDDYVDLGENYAGNSYSFEAWIKPAKDGGTIISGPNFNISAPSVSKERWTHVAVTGGKLYIDGVEKDAPSSGNGPGIEKTLIGARWNGSNATDFFNGWIEEVRIWNTTLTEKQIQFLMNQRIKVETVEIDGEIKIVPANSNDPIQGEIIGVRDMNSYHVDGNGFNLDEDEDKWHGLTWSNLEGYYRLISADPDPAGLVTFEKVFRPNDGTTIDLAVNSVPGVLKNMQTNQQNTAPLPYFTGEGGDRDWDTPETWARSIWNIPNSAGMDWNIVKLSHTISANREINVLGIVSEKDTFTMVGTNPDNWISGGTGNALNISHYLLLDGVIDLDGESQLLQPHGSLVDEASSGYLDRDQQGTASSYNYNYWSSPVSPGGTYNQSFVINTNGVMWDGTSAIPRTLDFGDAYTYADVTDYASNEKKKISRYWLHKFHGTSNNYFQWDWLGEFDFTLSVGEGFSMKGISGSAAISDSQNYTFRGLPNNGPITITIGSGENYLIGNPYPSALNMDKFLSDNVTIGNYEESTFNGSLYFWDHFGGHTHYLQEYVGGYAVANYSGGIESASSVDSRINNDKSSSKKGKPGVNIPVGQGFFISSVIPPIAGKDSILTLGGTVRFENDQRIFGKEGGIGSDVIFYSQERKDLTSGTSSNSSSQEVEQNKIWLKFKSPKGYHRQILVTADQRATNNFDLGFDAPMIDNNVEDMYWYFNNYQFVIQGVPDFDIERVLDLGIKVEEKGSLSISIDDLENIPDEMDIYVADSLLQVVHDLREEAYITESEAGIFTNRFKLVFQDKTEIEEPEIPVIEEGPFEVLYVTGTRDILVRNPELLQVDRIYLNNMLGQQVHVYYDVPSEKEVELPVKRFSAGVYIVKVHYEGGIMTKKVILE